MEAAIRIRASDASLHLPYSFSSMDALGFYPL